MYPFKSYRVLMYPVDEGGKKCMTVSILQSLRREFVYLLTYGIRSLVYGTHNDIVVS